MVFQIEGEYFQTLCNPSILKQWAREVLPRVSTMRMYSMDVTLSDSWDPRFRRVSDTQLRIFNKSVWQEKYWAIHLWLILIVSFTPHSTKKAVFMISCLKGVCVTSRKLKSTEKALFLAYVLKAKTLWRNYNMLSPQWGKEKAAAALGLARGTSQSTH